MKGIGFIVTPGFQVVSLSALGAFEFANSSVPRPVYHIPVLSQTGGVDVRPASSGVLAFVPLYRSTIEVRPLTMPSVRMRAK
jgi:hypothetical protein